jgi:hypothetical protein
MGRRCGVWMILALGAAALTGCGSGEAKYIPSENTARQALQTALDAWKGGRAKPDGLGMGKVAVQVVDDAWESGQPLKAYEILSEEPGSGPRWFTVKLTLPAGEQTVKFAVLGNNPLWVCDEPGYKKICGGL